VGLKMESKQMYVHEVLKQLQETPQGTKWHPEGNVLNHTAYVWGMLKDYPKLQWVAFFHDLGKINTTTYTTKKDGTVKITSYNHENYAVKYINKLCYFIPKDIDIEWLEKMCVNHMKIKWVDEMREIKRQEYLSTFTEDELIDLERFSVADDAVKFWQTTSPSQRSKLLVEFLDWVFEVFRFGKKTKMDFSLFIPQQPRTFLLVRGVSGSGKTSFANYLLDVHDFFHYEADMYHYDYDGNYNWKKENLQISHSTCKSKVIEEMMLNKVDVLVSNTSTSKWEVEEYQTIAENLGYRFVSIIVENRHGSKSVHDVPDDVLEKQRKRFDISL
jgi:hypothetical protein